MKQRLLLLGLFVCALACDSANPIAPTGTVLSVTANPSQISLTGQSTITVTGFKPDANPLNPGTQIIVSTSLGNLYHPTTGQQISVVEIDGNGRAVVLLRGDGRAGEATVDVTLSTSGGSGGGGGDMGGGGSTGASASTTVQIGQTDTDRPTVVISANPTIVDVLEVSQISLLGRNSDSTPVGAGQRIRLTADLGTLHARSNPTSTSPVITSVDTDANGEAVVYYRAGGQAGTGQVSAILDTSEEAVVSLEIRDVATEFSFLVDTNQIPVSGGEIRLTAVVVNARNEGVRNILVRFGNENSSGNSIGGTFSPSSAVLTDTAGSATTVLTLTANDLAGIASFNVTATVTIDEKSVTEKQLITVEGAGGIVPTAQFSFSVEGMELTVMDQSSNSPDSLEWDFGDGVVENGTPGETRMHTYDAAGTYEVKLTATNSAGSNSITKEVTIP